MWPFRRKRRKGLRIFLCRNTMDPVYADCATSSNALFSMILSHAAEEHPHDLRRRVRRVLRTYRHYNYSERVRVVVPGRYWQIRTNEFVSPIDICLCWEDE